MKKGGSFGYHNGPPKVIDEQLLERANKHYCPICGTELTGYRTDVHTEPFESIGYPRYIPVYQTITFEPCGHTEFVSESKKS